MKSNFGKNSANSGKLKRTITNVLAVVCLLALIVFMVLIDRNKAKTIPIVMVNQDIYPNQLILEEYFVKKDMPASEVQSSENKYLLWEDRLEAKDMYSTIFVKDGGYMYKGEYRDNKPLKNAWLQEVATGNLVITLPYNKSEAFGNILTPGDHLAVQISYDQESESQSDAFANVVTRKVSDSLFDKIKIIDLLNSSGNSIYDYYMDLLNLPIEQRDALLRDEGFLQNVAPNSMLLEVTPEQFVKYSKVKNLAGLTYTYGLHKREEGDIIVDQFQDISRQISNAQTQLKNTGE